MSLMLEEARQIPAVAERLLRDREAPYGALVQALRAASPTCVSLIGRGSSGQAAWYDLRVRLVKAAAGAEIAEPQFDALPQPPGSKPRPAKLRYGAEFPRRRR